MDLYKAARAYALHNQPGKLLAVGDIQRALRVGFNHAASLLEELEADRLLGSTSDTGARRWSVTLPVDESRVSMLRARRSAA